MDDHDAKEFDVSDEDEYLETDEDSTSEEDSSFKGKHIELEDYPLSRRTKRALMESGGAKVKKIRFRDYDALIFEDKNKTSDNTGEYARFKFGITSPNPYDEGGRGYQFWIDDKLLFRKSTYWFVNWFPFFNHASPPNSKWRYDFLYKSVTLHTDFGKKKSLGEAMELVAQQKLDPEHFYTFELSIKVQVSAWCHDGLGGGRVYAALYWDINSSFYSMCQYFIHPMFTRYLRKRYRSSSFRDLYIRIVDSSDDDGESRVLLQKKYWKQQLKGVTLRRILKLHQELFRDQEGVLDIEFLFSIQEHFGA